jgi:crotonobetainyl-CoA:carnitine CoA-transferase CaiB-like acyl-CoA transferase
MAAGRACSAGFEVVDLSEQVPGPYATRLARVAWAPTVVKVERPDAGDRLAAAPGDVRGGEPRQARTWRST